MKGFPLVVAVFLILCVNLAACGGARPERTAEVTSGPVAKEIALWPGKIPDARPAAGPETRRVSTDLVAGKPVTIVDNVTVPGMTLYPAKGKTTGVTLVVFPGGGYRILAIDLEGSEVCDWATARGITCVVLKYRVPGSGPWWDKTCHCHHIDAAPQALEDAQRAMGLLRQHAAEWGIDPHKIGVLGFSAGGHMVANLSTHYGQRAYAAVDAADAFSCRPDFAVALYPGHIWGAEYPNNVNGDIIDNITAETPPTFLLQNADDPVDSVENSRAYFKGLKAAKVPVEMHIYARGGHAFGLRPTAEPSTQWPVLVEAWLHRIHMIS